MSGLPMDLYKYREAHRAERASEREGNVFDTAVAAYVADCTSRYGVANRPTPEAARRVGFAAIEVWQAARALKGALKS